ncbi:MAG: CDP-glucose 4,6-dehydratase [Lachnospiraceae bacterium]|nr:CDP-glucose 4,6-dehydratase [Lachnospiraceae bacterium]
MSTSDFSFYKGKRVLVTGHTGFKGSWMCRVLQLLGADVCGYALREGLVSPLDNTYDQPSLFGIAGIENGMNSVVGDIRDYERLYNTFREIKPEIVIHMAAQPIVRTSYRAPRYTYEVNVMGTVNVLECARNTESVRSIVNVTTDKVYRNDDLDHAFKEDEFLDGYDPYSNSKSCSELVTSSYKHSFFNEADIPVSTCRAGNVIGGGDFASDRIVPDCYRAASMGNDIIVRNPYSTRPYQHVLEPVFAYLLVAMKQCLDHGYAGSYNIGPNDDSCINTGELADRFCTCWHKYTDSNIDWVNKHDGGPHEAGFLRLDNSLYKNTFGSGPVWNIDDALDKTVLWYATYYMNGDYSKCMDDQINEYLRLITEKY